MTDVAPRHPLAQCRRQLVAEDADQDFQQRFALPSEVGDLPEIDPEVECNSQHVHQALTDFSILTIERLGRCDLDLGQNPRLTSLVARIPTTPRARKAFRPCSRTPLPPRPAKIERAARLASLSAWRSRISPSPSPWAILSHSRTV